MSHQLFAFEYKAIFGLRASPSLLAPVLAERHRERHLATLLDNLRRFVSGQPLLNVVDKRMWC